MQDPQLAARTPAPTDDRRRQIAVLIDYENCALSNVARPSQFIDALRERGRLVVKRAFADWSLVDERQVKRLVQASIEIEALSSYRRNGKNAADIRLVVEAMEIAFRNPIVDTFIIVSGDSDYVPLVVKLRELGKYVILVADELQASRALTGYCDELIPVSRLAPEMPEIDADAEEFALLRRCLNSTETPGIIGAGVLKNMLLQLDSAFHESNFGFKRFSEFLNAAERAGVVKLSPDPNGGLQVHVD